MTSGTLQGISILIALISFLGICWWAFSKENKEKFDKIARYPFEEDNPLEKESDAQKDHKE
jgi:cytochrome c oxidase cbb3-type subunit 4